MLSIKSRLSVPLVSFEHFKQFQSHLIKQAAWYSIPKLGEKLAGRQGYTQKPALPKNKHYDKQFLVLFGLLMASYHIWVHRHTQLTADAASCSSTSNCQHGKGWWQKAGDAIQQACYWTWEGTSAINGDESLGTEENKDICSIRVACSKAGDNSITNKSFSFEWGKKLIRKFCQYFFLLSPPICYGKKGNRYHCFWIHMCGAPHTINQCSFSVQQEEGCDQQQSHTAFPTAFKFSYNQRLRIFFFTQISD